LAAGFKPVMCDISRQTLNLDTNQLESLVNRNTAAILATNLMGKACPIKKVCEISSKYNLHTIIDGCEYHGGSVDNRYMEYYGDTCCYSHYVAHPVGVVHGGVVTTNSPVFEETVRSIRSHGRQVGSLYFDHALLGGNFQPLDICASLVLGELENFWENFWSRKRIIKQYREELSCLEDLVYFVEEIPGEINSPHAFSLVLKTNEFSNEDLRKYMEYNGIEVKRNFGCCATAHKAVDFLGYKKGQFPEAEWAGEGLHWSCSQYLTQDDRQHVIKTVKTFFGK
jgi:dTDP-4-amino-4,6-dideoxygalactose transaminase